MGIKVYINGIVHDERDAFVSVFDRGFLYGDSVYEVLRTAGGRPVEMDAHLDRLERSAEALALDLPVRDTLLEAVSSTLAAAGNPESYVRIVVTRGAGEIGLDTALARDPQCIVIVKPLSTPDPACYRDGVVLQIVGVERTSRRAVDPAVKSGNYLNNIIALAEARHSGAYEAIMCDAAGRIAEGSTSNVFLVRGGQLFTPARDIGLLVGITRARVMSLARDAGLAVSETSLTPEDVFAADEVFITSSIRGVVPVRQVNETALPRPVPGPVCARLMALYDAYLAAVAAGR